MANMVEINLRPDARTLRQFGWIALGGFGLLALLAWQGWLVFARLEVGTRETVALWLLALAGLSTLFSLVWPKANLPIYLGLTLVAFPIGFVLSYVIMGVLFFGIIAPIGYGLLGDAIGIEKTIAIAGGVVLLTLPLALVLRAAIAGNSARPAAT